MLDRTFTVIGSPQWSDDQVREFGRDLMEWLAAYPAKPADLRLVTGPDEVEGTVHR